MATKPATLDPTLRKAIARLEGAATRLEEAAGRLEALAAPVETPDEDAGDLEDADHDDEGPATDDDEGAPLYAPREGAAAAPASPARGAPTRAAPAKGFRVVYTSGATLPGVPQGRCLARTRQQAEFLQQDLERQYPGWMNMLKIVPVE